MNLAPDNADRREPRLSAFFSPITELPADTNVTGEFGGQLRKDAAQSYRQVLTRHYLLRIAVAALLGAWSTPPAVLAYAVVVIAAMLAVRPGRAVSRRAALLAVSVTLAADVLLAGTLLSADPQSAGRMLLVASLVTWVAAFFFAWELGAGVGVASVLLYLAVGIPTMRVAQPLAFHAGNVLLFGMCAGMALWILARQQRFYSELHAFCRQVARGDIGIRLALASSGSGNPMVRLARDVDAMRKGLAEQIGVDALTGCLNRRALESRLRGEWHLARRRNGSVAIAAIDVDHFKAINDNFGHAAGDEVLRHLARIMRECTRESDAVARLGGDEFVLILPDTDEAGARILAERVREQTARAVFGAQGAPIAVTVSVGAVALRGRDDLLPSDVLDLADRALYQSKQGGRNRVSFGG